MDTTPARRKIPPSVHKRSPQRKPSSKTYKNSATGRTRPLLVTDTMKGVNNLLGVTVLCASLFNASALGLWATEIPPRTEGRQYDGPRPPWKVRELVATSDHSSESDLGMPTPYVDKLEPVVKHRVYRGTEKRTEGTQVVTEEASTEPIVSLEEPFQDAVRTVMKLMVPRMMELAYDPKLSTKCLSSLTKLWKGLSSYELWAMKMLDSSGKPPAGLMQGNIADLGAYDECLSISTPPSSGLGFRGQYCSLYVKAPGNPFVDNITARMIEDVPILRQFVKNVSVIKAVEAEPYVLGIRLGVCIPSACSADELQHLVATFIGKYGGKPAVPSCKVKTPVVLNSVQIAVISFVASLGVLIVVSSAIDVYYVQAKVNGERKPETQSLPVQLLLCFSAVTNTTKLFRCEVEPGSTRARQQCIHGIRVLGAMWVMLIHNYILAEPNTLGQSLGYLEMLAAPSFAVISNGFVSVDTFFLLSGFIVTEIVLSLKTKSSSLFVFIMTAYARYIRLSVPALFLVAIVFVYPLFVSGPVVDQLMHGIIEPCQNHWWDVLTHTTNFRDIADMCAPHLWYIATDFQIYVFFLVFIVALRSHPCFGLTGTVLTALASCIGTALQTYIYGRLSFPHAQISNLNKTLDTFEHIYFKPYCHMAPFAAGIVTAYLFMKRPQPKLNIMQRLTGWTASIAVGVAVIFGVHPWSAGQEYSLIAGSLYAGLSRLAWSLAVSWILYTCCTGNSSLINAFLSLKAFVPFSRLSFSVYLVHMLVVLVKPAMTRFPLQWTHWMLVKDYLGCSVISFILAYFFFLFCEAPLYNLDRLLMNKMFATRMRDFKLSTRTNCDTACKETPAIEEKKELGQQSIQPVFVVSDKVVVISSSKL